MSADNYYVIRPIVGSENYAVTMHFASDEELEYKEYPSVEDGYGPSPDEWVPYSDGEIHEVSEDQAVIFPDIESAFLWAQNEDSEYGVSYMDTPIKVRET